MLYCKKTGGVLAMKGLLKFLLSLIALAVAAFGILLLCEDKSDTHQYVTIYEDPRPDDKQG
jgi:hypothetical protein